MKDYWMNFLKQHGERIFWLAIATILATSFMFVDGMEESGKTFLIAVATLAVNKARSPKEDKNLEEPIDDRP